MKQCTFSTLAYLFMSISRLPFCSIETVDVASKAMSQARSALQTQNATTYYITG